MPAGWFRRCVAQVHVDSYTAILKGAVIGALAPRAPIAVAGEDRASFLQGLLTNDILALTPGTGCYAAWLTPQGRLHTDLHVLASGTMILLDVPSDREEATLQRLDQFIFTEDVRVSSLNRDLVHVWVHGPAASAVLASVVGAADLSSWGSYHHRPFDFEEEPVVVARIDQLGVPGYCIFVSPRLRQRLTARLAAAGATEADQATLEAARIEAGYPVFGVDMDEDTIPLEAGIENEAISFTKGCYVGQEIIIRVLHRGGGRVARRLVGLRLDGSSAERGSRITAAGKDIGRVTSAAVSPAFGSIALAYVHRDFVTPGTSVHVQTPSGPIPATVTARSMRSAA